VSLDKLEQDKATAQAVDALVDLSMDSMDVISWKLTELLDRLATVRRTNIVTPIPFSSDPNALAN
jgi:hypothetical protein